MGFPWCKNRGEGGRGTPYNGLYREAPPKGVPFAGFRYIKGWGNLSFGSVKGPKGLTDEFYGFIMQGKLSIFVIDSYLNDNAFTAVKRDAKF